MELKLKKVTIVRDNTDLIHLEVDLPNPLYPYNGNLVLKMEAPKPNGVEYVKKHFNITPELIDVSF